MEKTNELNKFLSYIHMGMSIYRIYYEHAVKLKNEKLINLIVEIQETFKTHEEKITKVINNFGEKATKSLTAAGKFGVCMEKMKLLKTSFDICINAIKAADMGMISSIKFLNDNKHLSKEMKEYIKNVINDYKKIKDQLIEYVLKELIVEKKENNYSK